MRLPDPDPQLELSVIIPARDEEEHLASTLASLHQQRDLDGSDLSPRRYEVILLINNSSDASLAKAERFRNAHPALRLHIVEQDFAPQDSFIGPIRRLLMNEACRRLKQTGNPLQIICSTDADTEVAPDWLAQIRREIVLGADAVGGLIHLKAAERTKLPPAVQALQRADECYQTLVARLEHHCDPQPHDAWPRHHHHFCGSMAVTTRAYQAVGGLPPERALEDVALYNALIASDHRVRHSPQVQVWTSARLTGRTGIGLAGQLLAWNQAGAAPHRLQVLSATYLHQYFLLRRRFRTLWRPTAAEPYFGRAWETSSLRCSISPARQPLTEAITQLNQLLTKQIDAVPLPPDRRQGLPGGSFRKKAVDLVAG